ncbi:MAG TPA: ribosome biogenesis GTP-binding protein YihA/YsxC [Flavobacteriaceae bacterium]|nr:ribosome biogenesis GTP-binding protein YihA/YsxC [Flavobacteriaceae bacterium]
MKINSAEFIISNSDVSKCPEKALPEYAFIGRSNVGKSSLINMLTERKNLAKTSGRPGKTQLINHFLINQNWYLVDLPGYGYARVSKKAKKTFQKFITDYFEKRKQLVCAFVLIDARHEPQKIDMDFMQWLGENGVPFGMIFTKADKLKPKALDRNIVEYTRIMLEIWEEMPPVFITSSTNNFGKETVLEYIEGISENLTGSTNR